jgi:hypothetical protein
MPQLPLVNLATEVITYGEAEFRDGGSPQETGFGGEPPAMGRRVFKVTPWSKRHIFCRWCLGEVAVDSDTTPATLTRTPPQRHPLYTGLIANRIASVRGYLPAPTRPAAGAGTRVYTLTDYDQAGTEVPTNYELAEYESAIIEVEYAHARYHAWGDGEAIANDLTDEFERYTEFLEPKASADFLQLPGMTIIYTRPGGPPGGVGVLPHGTGIPYGVGLILPLEEFTVAWRRIPFGVVDPLGGSAGALDGGGSGSGSSLSALYRRIYGDPTDPTKKPYLGTINKTQIFGRAAGTLALTGFHYARRDGPIPTTHEADLYYTFTFDPNRGWDRKYYHPNNRDNTLAGWYYVSRSGTYHAHGSIPDGDSQYNEREFADLWKVGELP